MIVDRSLLKISLSRCFPPFISIYKFKFQSITHGFGSWLYSKAFQKVGFFLFVCSQFSLAQHRCFLPLLSSEQLRVLTIFSMSSLSSLSNLLLQNGWLNCKLKSKQVLFWLYFVQLFSLSASPIQLPFPQSLALSSAFHQLPFCSMSFISSLSPAGSVKPQPQTHTSSGHIATGD